MKRPTREDLNFQWEMLFRRHPQGHGPRVWAEMRERAKREEGAR